MRRIDRKYLLGSLLILIFLLIFIFLRLTSLIWFSYLLDASDGKVTLDNIKSTVGFGAIYVIFYNAPIYYLFIISLEFICKKLEDKFLFQFFALTDARQF